MDNEIKVFDSLHIANPNDDSNLISSPPNVYCFGCVWLDDDGSTRCAAFPKGIPHSYLFNKEHSEVSKDQVGDFVYCNSVNLFL